VRPEQTRCLVHLRPARPSASRAPLVFPHLRVRRSWWRPSRPMLLALGYPACFAMGAVVALGTRP
jgi:hypothetical protein